MGLPLDLCDPNPVHLDSSPTALRLRSPVITLCSSLDDHFAAVIPLLSLIWLSFVLLSSLAVFGYLSTNFPRQAACIFSLCIHAQ